jgi:hypothetical protein
MILKRNLMLYDFLGIAKIGDMVATLIALVIACIPAHVEATPFLGCGQSENMIFKCTTKTKTAFLCKSKASDNAFHV